MSETKYESKITSSKASALDIFNICSNFENIDKVKDLIPKDRVKEIECEQDLLRFKMDGLGQKIGIRIIDKEEGNFIKYGLENAPVDGNFWIQLKEVAPGDTRIRLTVKADLPMMFKMMLDKKLQEGLDQGADMLAQMPFDQWADKA